MAVATSTPPVFDPPAPSGVTVEQLQAVMARLENVESENRRLMEGRGAPPASDNPVYEMAAAYYAADDIYYPEGAQFEDLTGELVPNEHFVPLNPAAEARVRWYLRSLPHAQRTPTIDNLIMASMKLRPREGDDPVRFAEAQARMVEAAFKEQYGVNIDDAEPASLRPAQRGASRAPLMPNTRIRGQEGIRGDPRSQLRQAPIPAANRTTRAMGTVQSTPLGTEPAGVTV